MVARTALRAGAILLVFAVVPSCSFDGQFSAPFGTTVLNAVLGGSQVVPAVVVAASGTASLGIDDPQNNITYSVSATGVGVVTSVRIHLGEPGRNGPAIFTLATGPFTNPLTGTLTGFDFTPAPGVSTLHAATGQILNGKAYILISTVANPTGEIRGQIGPVALASAKLSGAQVVAPVVTAAAGNATFQLNGVQDRIDVVLTFTGIPTAASAHLHVANTGAGGPAVFNLAVAPFSSPLSITLTSADFIVAGGLTTFAEALNALLSGRLYVDVETIANPGGEIRGQVGPARLSSALAAANVVPTNSSIATGIATLALNGRQDGVTVNLTHTLGTPTGVLLHADLPGSNGPLIFDVAAAAAGGSTSPLEAFLDQFSPLVPQASKAVNNFPDAADALLTGRIYIDVSSTGFPAGEIRGQIVP